MACRQQVFVRCCGQNARAPARGLPVRSDARTESGQGIACRQRVFVRCCGQNAHARKLNLNFGTARRGRFNCHGGIRREVQPVNYGSRAGWLHL